MAHADSVPVFSDFLRGSSSSAEKLIYMVITSKAHNNVALVSLRELSRLSGLAVNTVRKAIHNLQAHNYVSTYTCRGFQTAYRLHQPQRHKQSVKVPLAILYNCTITPLTKVVYSVLLAFRSYNQGKCCPSYATLARCLGKSIRTMQRTIAALRGCHAIKTTLMPPKEGRYPHNEYTMLDGWVATQHNNCATPKTWGMYDRLCCGYITDTDTENRKNRQKKACDGISGSNTGKSKNNCCNNISGMHYTPDTEQSQVYIQNNANDTITAESLKTQISYDWLITNNPTMRMDIDTCINVLLDGVTISRNKPITISGQQYDYDRYVVALQQLQADNILLALNRFRNRARTTHIGNPLPYLRSVLINTIDDIDMHYVAQVEYDIYNP